MRGGGNGKEDGCEVRNEVVLEGGAEVRYSSWKVLRGPAIEMRGCGYCVEKSFSELCVRLD